jgi:DnaJ family protein A protein 2
MPDLYERLEVSKGANADEIKKAYMKMARKHHPDKGGDAELFKGVQEAYEVLSDDRRRQVYDATGSVDANHQQQQHGGGGGFPFPDIFASMFGGAGGGGVNISTANEHRKSKGPDSQANIGLSLDNFYNGFEMNINFKQSRKCPECKHTSAPCSDCGGRGVRTVMRQMGPMVFQAQGACDSCRGCGTQNTAASPCKICSEKRYVETEKRVTVNVTPGMREGENIVFAGECSESPEYETPGDVVVTLRLAPSRYEWKGDNLHLTHTISFKESILGFVVTLDDHPSRKQQVLRWSGGPLIHGAVLSMDGKGMPKKGGEFGDLKIKLNISEPPRVPWTEEQHKILETIF